MDPDELQQGARLFANALQALADFDSWLSEHIFVGRPEALAACIAKEEESGHE